MTGTDGVVRRVAGCTFRWIRGEIVVLRRDGSWTRLGGAGAVVWATLDEATPVDQIVGRIEHDWPELGRLEPATVQDALTVLEAEGLVEQVPSPA